LKPRRRDGRDFPLASSLHRHLVRKPPVLRDHIRVADRQQSLQSAFLAASGTVTAAVGEYGALSSRSRRHAAIVRRDTGFRDRSAGPALAASSDTIHFNPDGSSMPHRERILKYRPSRAGTSQTARHNGSLYNA
jgi:hypothetical protein